MINVTLKIAEDVIHVKAASSLDELQLRNYIVFSKKVQPLIKADVEGDDDALSDVPAAHVVVDAVEAFLGLDPGALYKAKEIYFNEQSQAIDALFAHCVNVCSQRFFDIDNQPETFTYKNEIFEYPFRRSPLIAQYAAGRREKMTVAEFVEASEIARIASQKVKDDPDGSALYSYYLHLIAILCRKPEEQLPVEHEDMQRFIADRAAFFADIDAQTALVVDFFSEVSLSSLRSEQTAFTSLTKFHLLLQLATQPHQLRRRRPELKFKRKPKLHLSARAGAQST